MGTNINALSRGMYMTKSSGENQPLGDAKKIAHLQIQKDRKQLTCGGWKDIFGQRTTEETI